MSEHNSQKEQLKLAIESMLNQTYKDFIFMIVDDDTNQENKKLLAEFAKKDSRIKIVKNEVNLGFVNSLNKAIGMTDTKYIVRMDSDDISHPERLEKQLEFMEEHPQYAFAGTRANFFDENGIYLTSNMFGEIGLDILVRFCVFFHSSLIIRTDELKQIGMYKNYKRNEDYVLYFDFYHQGFKGYVMQEVLLDYRQNADSYKRKKYGDRIIEAQIRGKYFRLLKVNPIIGFVYTVKPLIVGLIPKMWIFKYKRKRNIR